MQQRLEEPEQELKRVIRGAIYARYSSEMQSPTSAQDQVDRIFHLTEKNQILSRRYPGCRVQILQDWIHKDEAFSGRVAGRRGYQTILDGVRQKNFDIIIVDDLSRLTRSLGNLLELYQLLRHYDVELISVVDQLSSDDSNARTYFTVKGMIADFGNEAHAERTKRGLEARALSQFSTGQKPFGYDSTPTQSGKRKGKIVHSHFKVILNEELVGIVRQIFELYSQGFGKCYIAKWLNDKKIKAPKGCSRGWQNGPITRILRNEKYIGHWTFNKSVYSCDPDTGKKVRKPRSRKDWIVSKREDLRIVPQDLWDAVQKRLGENKEEQRRVSATKEQKVFGNHNRVDNRGLLTGIVVCSKCGGACALVTGRRGGYYGCIDAHRHGTCDQKFLLRKSRAEISVVSYLKENLSSNTELLNFATREYNDRAREYVKKFPNRRKEIESELKRLVKEIDNLVNFISSGVATDLDSVAGALREKETRKCDLEYELDSLGSDDNDKVPLITPFAVKEKLAYMVEKICEKSDRFNGSLSALFDEPLQLSKADGAFILEGRVNVGAALSFQGVRQYRMAAGSNVHLANPESLDGNQGSRQCTNASPTGFEPVSSP